jgi:hypothetical protein
VGSGRMLDAVEVLDGDGNMGNLTIYFYTMETILSEVNVQCKSYPIVVLNEH